MADGACDGLPGHIEDAIFTRMTSEIQERTGVSLADIMKSTDVTVTIGRTDTTLSDDRLEEVIRLANDCHKERHPEAPFTMKLDLSKPIFPNEK